jgi:hypothetical protein
MCVHLLDHCFQTIVLVIVLWGEKSQVILIRKSLKEPSREKDADSVGVCDFLFFFF